MQRTTATLKQKRFAKAYVLEGNGTEAAVRAGYKVKNRDVAAMIATENMRNPLVQREILSWQAKLEQSIMPSLEVVEKWRDQDSDPRISLSAARDLLNRAGVGKQNEAPRSVIAVFANMDESKLLEKMAQLSAKNSEDNGQGSLPPASVH